VKFGDPDQGGGTHKTGNSPSELITRSLSPFLIVLEKEIKIKRVTKRDKKASRLLLTHRLIHNFGWTQTSQELPYLFWLCLQRITRHQLFFLQHFSEDADGYSLQRNALAVSPAESLIG